VVSPIDLLRVVWQIVLKTNVDAFDVTEATPTPPYDHADITTNNTHRLIWETLTSIAHRKRERQKHALCQICIGS
jgi:hypothetical protein